MTGVLSVLKTLALAIGILYLAASAFIVACLIAWKALTWRERRKQRRDALRRIDDSYRQLCEGDRHE